MRRRLPHNREPWRLTGVIALEEIMPRAIKIPQIETIVAIILTVAICLLLLSAVMDVPIKLNLP